MKLRYLLILAFLLPMKAQSQPSETIYLGNTVYSGYSDNAAFGPYSIGFSFVFYGNTYNQFYISSNGLLTFVTGSADNSPDQVPSPSLPDNYIAPFWDDLIISPFGNILYTTIGAAPNRKLVVQSRNMSFFTAPAYLGTFSIILTETTNKIQIQYRTIVLKNNSRATGGTATIGIENSDGTSGIQYSFQTPYAINSAKAISFTPSGSTYLMNSDEIYEGIYLTTDLNLPEPGITEMMSPSNDITIGTDVTFEWSASEYASSHFVKLSLSPSLLSASTYNAGSNLSYYVSGLIPDTTYYWTVFSSNSTGNTWNEVRKFKTSSDPPLVGIPQTIWTEQGQEKTIKLNFTGGDASVKTAIIASLPVQGQLYQYNAGVKGDLISAVPANVTDPAFNVIYVATGASGNGAGNFSFMMNDDTGDSPVAQVTINVSPPGIPSVLYIAKGSGVEIQFDRQMADPAGKHSQFTVTVNGTPATMTSAALKTGDPYTIALSFTPALTGTETVLVSYTQGDVTSTAGGFLLSFTDQAITLRSQTISFTQTLDKKYNESPFNLTATASSGLGLTYSSSNLAVATISSNVVTLKSLGTSDMTARQAGNGTYAPARYVRTMTVSKGDQTITYNPLPDKTYGDADFLLSAVASSGLQVAWLSINTDVAAITGNTVNITGAGTTTITASQAGNSLWNPATPVDQSLTINKADQTITFNPLADKETGDPDFDPGATASSGLTVSYSSDNLAVATIVSNLIHIVDQGTTNITASQAGNSNYNAAADVIQPLTVNLATGLEKITSSPNSFKIYSSFDLIHIQTLDSDWDGNTGSVRVFNIIGKPVSDLHNIEFLRNTPVQIQAPEVKGVYVVEIKSGLKRCVGKVIIR